MSYTTPSALTPSRPAPSPSMYSSQSMSSKATLASNGYGPAFTFNPGSASGSSYSTSYSGIGGSPSSNGTGAGGVVRQGPVSVKEDGTLTSWIWKIKWLVLKDMTLTLQKSEVRSTVLSMIGLHVSCLCCSPQCDKWEQFLDGLSSAGCPCAQFISATC